MNLPAFPKPSQVKKPPVAVRVFRGGREVCNHLIKAGRDEYERRKRKAWEDQKHICAICHKPLNWADTTADHIKVRGMGGGSRDDRQENLAAVHWTCNTQRGSRTKGFYGVD
jgi:5-methylcytosine-specific restriction endonuclease McrA